MSLRTGRKTRAELPRLLLRWYDRHRRDLPWRAGPGEASDPYRVWLSEVMLQQTTVAAVAPRYLAFLERWPNVAALAAAPLEEVLHEWQGLGYYARARNLHRCARAVVEDHGGAFPSSEAGLRALPGIGAYTAAAVAAIAFGRPATPVDGNIERVMARLHCIETPLPAAKPELHEAARGLTPARRAGDYAQAVMDLGATICTPRRPRCPICPWRTACAALAAGRQDELPFRAPRTPRPTRYGVVFWVETPRGVMLRRRPAAGLLGGMMEFPSTPWREAPWRGSELAAHAPVRAKWRPLDGEVEHVFTHFRLKLSVVRGRAAGDGDALCAPPDAFGDHALPTVMKKVARRVLGDG